MCGCGVTTDCCTLKVKLAEAVNVTEEVVVVSAKEKSFLNVFIDLDTLANRNFSALSNLFSCFLYLFFAVKVEKCGIIM